MTFEQVLFTEVARLYQKHPIIFQYIKFLLINTGVSMRSGFRIQVEGFSAHRLRYMRLASCNWFLTTWLWPPAAGCLLAANSCLLIPGKDRMLENLQDWNYAIWLARLHLSFPASRQNPHNANLATRKRQPCLPRHSPEGDGGNIWTFEPLNLWAWTLVHKN